MPPKIREHKAALEAAGFVDRGGKGIHRNCVHPKRQKPITMSGRDGEDAKRYQEKQVREAIKEVKS